MNTETIRQDTSSRRNPTLTDHAVNIHPYRGIGTWIPRALHDWPTTELVDDPAGNQFKAVLRRPAPETGAGKTPPGVTGEVRRLLTVMAGRMRHVEMQQALGLKQQDHFREVYLQPALQAGLIEMTVSDKPTSLLQRYRLTTRGAAIANAAEG